MNNEVICFRSVAKFTFINVGNPHRFTAKDNILAGYLPVHYSREIMMLRNYEHVVITIANCNYLNN